MNKVRIERVESEDGMPTSWMLWVDGQRVSWYPTFRKAWNAAKKVNPDTTTYDLDPLDQ